MTDTRTPQQRRKIMQAVGTKNTGPEVAIRKELHKRGYRYRLHLKTLPGRPDIVFPKRKKAIFVHGCFWHGHKCQKGQLPKSRQEYWAPKIQRNCERDMEKTKELEKLGWRVTVIWQCELKRIDEAVQRLVDFLDES